jgi:hypothetical protein
MRLVFRLAAVLLLAAALTVALRRSSSPAPTGPAGVSQPIALASPAPPAPPSLPAVQRPVLTNEARLMPSADRRWRAAMPEHDFARFRDWTDRYVAADSVGKAELTAEGVAKARARREDLAALIRQDPRRAIELAVPVGIRSALPTEVVAQLEQRVDGRGELAVLGATPGPEAGADFESFYRTAAVNGDRFRAFVYGRREGEPTRFDVALHGIALDGQLAVDENPLRVLEAAEAAPILARDPVCAVSGLAAASFGEPVVVDDGSQNLVLCSPAHAELLNEQRILAESGGSGLATPDGLPQPASAYTEGMKRLLFIRVDFSDLAGTPFSDLTGTNLTRNLSQFYVDQSYARTGFKLIGEGSTITPTLRMPKTAKYYGTNDAALLMTDARNAATTAGFPQGNFDFDLICFGNVPGFSFAGLGYVGGRGCWIRAAFDTAGGVPGHELGHNYGLNHANFWDTAGVSATAVNGNNVEYGDPFDTMGNASAGKRHFNARSKALLNWLVPAGVRTITTNGTYRVFAMDATNATGIRALKFARNAKTNYWFEFRQRFTDNRWLMSGLGVRWARSDNNQQSLLLDTTPGSADGKDDSAVVIGRTFDDPAIHLHVTPIGQGGTVPESLDVVVMIGAFPSNQPPTLAIGASTLAPAVNAAVTLTATAADADGDALAYYWDFGDGTFGNNSATAQKSWTTAGEYLVRCTATDMKGGTASDSVLVRVGNPTTVRLAGRVLHDGQPVQGVRVSVSNTKLTYTDSDGTYLLPGLTKGTYTVTAAAEGLLFTKNGFTNPLVLNANRSGIDFNASLPGDLEMATLVPSGSEWRFWDLGTTPGITWQAGTFNDSLWRKGAALLGYGDPGVVTTVDFGPDANARYITTYFRHAFTVDDPSRFLAVTLGLLRDDGGVVYLNGKEVFRSNLPTGTVNFGTLASTTVGGTDERTFFETDLNPASFVKGTNTLAVEIHQSSADSSDLSFDLQLTALMAPPLVPPALTLSPASGGGLRISWPVSYLGWHVETVAQLDGTAAWQVSDATVESAGGQQSVVLPLTDAARFYRLTH